MPVAAVRPLRHAVLRPDHPFDLVVWLGDDDPAAAHLAAYPAARGTAEQAEPLAEPVGVLSLLPHAYPRPGGPGDREPEPWRPPAGRHYQLRGMAVLPELHGGGVGGALLRAALGLLRERDAALVWCNARMSAARFYHRHGFVPRGPVFILPPNNIPHVRMTLAVTGAGG